MAERSYFRALPHPNRVQVCDRKGKWLAIITLAGPRRSFTEQIASVSHSVWVRALPQLFSGEPNFIWLGRALRPTTRKVHDILAKATQDIQGALRASQSFGVLGDPGAHEGAALFTSRHWLWTESLRVLALTGLQLALTGLQLASRPRELGDVLKFQEPAMLRLDGALRRPERQGA